MALVGVDQVVVGVAQHDQVVFGVVDALGAVVDVVDMEPAAGAAVAAAVVVAFEDLGAGAFGDVVGRFVGAFGAALGASAPVGDELLAFGAAHAAEADPAVGRGVGVAPAAEAAELGHRGGIRSSSRCP